MCATWAASGSPSGSPAFSVAQQFRYRRGHVADSRWPHSQYMMGGAVVNLTATPPSALFAAGGGRRPAGQPAGLQLAAGEDHVRPAPAGRLRHIENGGASRPVEPMPLDVAGGPASAAGPGPGRRARRPARPDRPRLRHRATATGWPSPARSSTSGLAMSSTKSSPTRQAGSCRNSVAVSAWMTRAAAARCESRGAAAAPTCPTPTRRPLGRAPGLGPRPALRPPPGPGRSRAWPFRVET